jgi:hypothetical protein
MPNSRLTVTGIQGRSSFGKTVYATNCDCGGPFSNRVVATGWHLLHGKPSSCGRCSDKYKYMGLIRGEMKVIGISGDTYKSAPLYELECSCGKVVRWRSCQLMRSHHPTCGDSACRAKNLKGWVLPLGEGAFRGVRRRYQQRATKEGRVYALSDEQLRTLMTSRCHYCGTFPYRRTKGSAHGPWIYNGVDRIDCALGYTSENVVSCCTPCNLARGRIKHELFFGLVKLIGNRHHLLRSASKREEDTYNKQSDSALQLRRIPHVSRLWI